MANFSRYGTPAPEWTAYAATLPPRPTFSSKEEEKAHYNGMREKLAAGGFAAFNGAIATRDYTIPTRDGATVEARTYIHTDVADKTGLPVYVHLHGGGFFFGTLASEDGICARIAADTGAVVLNVNYRHTPEVAHPTANYDVQDAYAWLHARIADAADPVLGGGRADPAKVVIGGISAGAHLTASMVVAHHLGDVPGCEVLKGLPKPAGQVLMITPLVNPECFGPFRARLADPEASSYEQCAEAPIIPKARIKFFMDMLVSDPDPTDLVLNPGLAPKERLAGLPPTTFGVCGMDPLRDEALLWAMDLTEIGVPTNVHIFPGFPHGFRASGSKLSEAACQRWDDVMHGGIKWALTKPEATGVFEIKEK